MRANPECKEERMPSRVVSIPRSKSNHILCGQYDDLQGSTHVLWQRQVAFRKQWQGLHLFSDTTSSLRWNYAIPSFLLHSSKFLLHLFLTLYHMFHHMLVLAFVSQ